MEGNRLHAMALLQQVFRERHSPLLGASEQWVETVDDKRYPHHTSLPQPDRSGQHTST